MSALATLKSPFPYFGGKSRVASLVWPRFGDVRNYVEPFFGSGAMLLARPQPFAGAETVNDLDGMVANFWRALQADPDQVAHWADWPVNENDLHARHIWLVEGKDSLQSRLEGDPDYFDARTAGWWCWGLACWIGGAFCGGKGPWRTVELNGVRHLVRLGDKGQGVKRQRVNLGSRGVNRQLVHLGNGGQGVKRKRIRESNGLVDWMRELAERLKQVRVCCGDWSRVCTPSPTVVSGVPTAVFLDPPYADMAGRSPRLYCRDSLTVAHAVRDWAIQHGDDKRYRIALCGYEGEHEMPKRWACVPWKAPGGYANQSSKRSPGGHSVNSHRERIWFSPHCLDGSNF